MREKGKPGLNFYSRKGAAFDAKNAKWLFFPWIIIMFLTLGILRLFLIVFDCSYEIYQLLHEWNSEFLFGLDMTGAFQMISLLIGAYILAHFGVYITERHKNKREFYIGTALHVFGLVICILYIIAHNMYITWLERL